MEGKGAVLEGSEFHAIIVLGKNENRYWDEYTCRGTIALGWTELLEYVACVGALEKKVTLLTILIVQSVYSYNCIARKCRGTIVLSL